MSRDKIISQIEVMSMQECGAYACHDYLSEHTPDGAEHSFGEQLPLNKRWIAHATKPVDSDCRSRMTEWFFVIADHCQFDSESVSIAMSYLDRFLMTESGAPALLDRNAYQLAAMTAFYIAIKVFEPEVMDPEIVSSLSHGAYTAEDIVEMELVMLSSLEWRVQPPTALSFIRHYLALVPESSGIKESVRTVLLYISRIQTEFALKDHSLIATKPSSIAIASILNTMERMDKECIPDSARRSLLRILRQHGSISLYGDELRKIQKILLNQVVHDSECIVEEGGEDLSLISSGSKITHGNGSTSPRCVKEAPPRFNDRLDTLVFGALRTSEKR